MKIDSLKDVLYFKETISILLISLLFILLAAHIDLEDLELIFNWRAFALFAAVVLIVRPVGVFLSTRNSNIKFNEKLFISWVGPRGIVAAGIASLFGLKLTMMGVEDANYITPLVFMIVLGTVLLNATTAHLFAKVSGVLLKKSEGILIIGASKFARLIASYLQDNGRRVVLIDSNPKHVENARKMNLEAYEYDVYNDDLTENVEFNDIGYLLALTASDSVNQYAVNKFKKAFGEQGYFRLINASEMTSGIDDSAHVLFSCTDDYLNISEVVRDYPQINEVDVNSEEEFVQWLKKLREEVKSIPLFVKDTEGTIHIIPSDHAKLEIKPGTKLMYVGKKVDFTPQNSTTESVEKPVENTKITPEKG